MMRMIIQTKRQTAEGHAAVRAANVDVTADVEPRDPDSKQGDDTTDPNSSTSTKKAAATQTATPSVDVLEPWVDNTTRATHKADDLSAASGITSWILRQSQITGGRQG